MLDNYSRDLDCPFVGLQPYEEVHRDYFFGRERERRIIAANLYASPLSVLYGASGVGKSSILRAGVAVDLRQAPRTAVIYFNAWHDESFVERLKQQCLDAVRTASGQQIQVNLAVPLDDLFAVLQEQFRGSILVLLDQFEEYFLYHNEEETADTFDAELARSVNRDDLDVSILVALRDDWLARLDRFRARIPNLLGNTIRLTHLDAIAAEDAICKPLAVWNDRHDNRAGIEDLLVKAIIRDVRTGRVSLIESAGLGEARGLGERDEIEAAFLQLVLIKLWSADRQNGFLRLATYDSLGGAIRIVQTHLNNLLNRLTDSERESCARMFPYLVTPTGSKIAHETSDLVAFSERTREETVLLLITLSDQRILRRIAQPERYEIFHDVLAPAILDWCTRHIQAKEQQQRRAEEQLRAEARTARKLRFLVWTSFVLLLFVIGAAWYARGQRLTAMNASERSRLLEIRANKSEVLSARNAAKLATLQRDLAEKGRLKAEAQNRVISSLKEVADKQAALAKLNERVSTVRLVLAAILRSKENSDPQEKRAGILMALGALRASNEVTKSEAEDALRQTVDSLPIPLPLPLHTKPVKEIVFSPDGGALATTDGEWLKVWDLPSRQDILSLKSSRSALLFSPDGRSLAVGGPDGFSLYRLSEKAQLLIDEKMPIVRDLPKAIIPLDNLISAMIFSGNDFIFRSEGREVALAHPVPDKRAWSLMIWETATGRPLRTQSDMPGFGARFAFSADGNRLAKSGERGITILDVASANEIGAIDVKVGSNPIQALISPISLNEDGTRLAVAANEAPGLLSLMKMPSIPPSVSVWGLGSSEPLVNLPLAKLGSGLVTGLSFRADGRLRVRTEAKDYSLEIPSGLIESMKRATDFQPSPDGKYQAVNVDGGVRINGEDGSRLTVSGSLKMTSAAFQLDGGLLITGDADGTIRLWDFSSLHSLGKINLDEPPLAVAVSRDSRLIAAVTGGLSGIQQLKIWERENLLLRQVCSVDIGSKESMGDVFSLAFSPEGSRLATAQLSPPGVSVWNTRTCSHGPIWKRARFPAGVDFSPPDGRRLAVSGEAAVRDEQTGSIVELGSSIWSGIAWSPDASLIATEDHLWDLTIPGQPKVTQLLDTESAIAQSLKEEPKLMQMLAAGLTIQMLTAGQIAPCSRRVAFSPDGQFLATAGFGRTVRLWNRSGRRVANLYGHDGEILSLAFTANGREVLVVTDKWKIYRHPVPLDDLVIEAHKRAPGPLDPKACARLLGLADCPNIIMGGPQD